MKVLMAIGGVVCTGMLMAMEPLLSPDGTLKVTVNGEGRLPGRWPGRASIWCCPRGWGLTSSDRSLGAVSGSGT